MCVHRANISTCPAKNIFVLWPLGFKFTDWVNPFHHNTQIRRQYPRLFSLWKEQRKMFTLRQISFALAREPRRTPKIAPAPSVHRLQHWFLLRISSSKTISLLTKKLFAAVVANSGQHNRKSCMSVCWAWIVPPTQRSYQISALLSVSLIAR